jgi:glycosyltransferase involved in cell wall biosynthesis
MTDAAALAPRIADYAHLLPAVMPVDRPLVSVVTVTFNAARTLARTIDSVQRESLPTEQIFVDGGSRDATLAMIRQRMRSSDRLLSEPDRGISDAINKGIAMARAPFISILHADDWHEPGQLETALREKGRAPILFGDVLLHVDGKPWFHERGQSDYADIVRSRMPSVPHPSMLFERAVFERIGLYRIDLRLAMDYEWLLRSVVLGERALHVPGICPNMTLDGVSNTRFWKTMKEVSDIAISYGYPRLQSRAELLGRFAKTATGRWVRNLSPSLYQRLRKQINPQMS